MTALNPQGALNLITQGLSAPTSLNTSGLDLSKVITIEPLKILSTMEADLNQAGKSNTPYASANAVNVNGGALNNAVQNVDLSGLHVTVDPFDACAASAAQIAACAGHTGAQTSAANILVSAGLPAINLSGVDTSQLQALATTLGGLIDTLTNTLANPPAAQTILGAAPVPAPLAGALGTLGTLVNGAAASTSNTIGTDLLQQWKTELTTIDSSLKAIINSLAALQLPDVTQLVSSANDIATAKTVPTTAGGVLSTATTSVGSLSVLPVGGSLAGAINGALKLVPSVAGLTFNTLKNSTPLLEIDGITSSAQAGVGSVPTCTNAQGVQDYLCGTSGLKTVSVLGQTIDLDNGTLNGIKLLPTLGPGAELRHVFSIPGVGSVTLDITRGLPQTIANTASYRAGSITALDVRLINGAVGGDCTGTCSDPLPSTNTSTGAHTAATNAQGGIVALGHDGDTVVGVTLANAAVSAGVPTGTTQPGDHNPNPPSGCGITITCPPTTSVVSSQTSLPSTGMFGGGALPAGLLLIAVAISLRLVPSHRIRFLRVR
jgi:hypothetical protein